MSKGKRSVVVVATAATLVLVLAGPALAGKPSGGGGGGGKKGGGGTTTGGSGSLVLKDLTRSDNVPHWGDQITFTVSTNATTEPMVNVTCTQGGTTVYGAVTGYYPTYPWPWTNVMTLSSQSWTGGDADCTADLNYYKGTSVVHLTTMPFKVFA
jgi:hypothetical protein